MRNVGDELTLAGHEPLDPSSHEVEIANQLADLVTTRGHVRHTRGQFPFRQSPSRGAQSQYRAGEVLVSR